MTVEPPLLLVGFCLLYSFLLFGLSRSRRVPPPAYDADNLFFVFLVPCLDEERVVGASLQRLMELPQPNFAVMVIDDGSTDGTADIVTSFDPTRVWLHRRVPPMARQGKGEALNDAYRTLRRSPLLQGRDHRDIVLAVLDADGRLAPTALTEVAPLFIDPRVGGVQVGVRMYNARESLLARLQDVEFVTFTEVFQRGRQRIGSVGLGGNGQFNRLAALETLGEAPWTDCLTEDLDLGIRLMLQGWSNTYCPTTHVSQQAVVEFRRLLRQRSRWFQGHLQCWRRIPEISRSGTSHRVAADLILQLVAASFVLIMSFVNVAFIGALLWFAVVDPENLLRSLTVGGGVGLVLFYALTFGSAGIHGFLYWLRTPDCGLVRCLFWTHIYSAYSYLWIVAGWRAVARLARGRRDWAKTARTVQVVEEAFTT